MARMLLLALSYLFALTNGLPTTPSRTFSRAEQPTPFTNADTVRVTLCTDINWAGTCTDIYTTPGGSPSTCKVLDGTASSIGPMEGVRCVFYRTDNCDPIPGPSGGALPLTFPGLGNLFSVPGQENPNWNDAVRSFNCFRLS
ncbi:hypothetical protein BDV96DRAFT_53346 [Lophiotrema nucula]|uniref:Beta/gamma crystallin 'Greek key' domain-containing protein n=1 Tax=Lophiotrema nucula TaxID=690887 RepID=A0A6A5ZB38_9PLEO|nr:hypothetical protein BDV96DRAFT_53346 [Lophiotrema nucula]